MLRNIDFFSHPINFIFHVLNESRAFFSFWSPSIRSNQHIQNASHRSALQCRDGHDKRCPHSLVTHRPAPRIRPAGRLFDEATP